MEHFVTTSRRTNSADNLSTCFLGGDNLLFKLCDISRFARDTKRALQIHSKLLSSFPYFFSKVQRPILDNNLNSTGADLMTVLKQIDRIRKAGVFFTFDF